jgi:hypothetical protein
MRQFLSTFVLLLMTSLLFTACGKTDEQKAKEKVNEHNAIVKDLENMGYISPDWSVEKLTTYRDKCDRLIVLEAQLGKLDKKNDDIKIIGNNNTQTWTDLRTVCQLYIDAKQGSVKSGNKKEKVEKKEETKKAKESSSKHDRKSA